MGTLFFLFTPKTHGFINPMYFLRFLGAHLFLAAELPQSFKPTKQLLVLCSNANGTSEFFSSPVDRKKTLGKIPKVMASCKVQLFKMGGASYDLWKTGYIVGWWLNQPPKKKSNWIIS